MIKFQCSNCNHKLGTEERYAGKQVRCPKCRTAIRVPEPVEKKETREQGVIKFRCPSCNQKIGLTADYAGKRVRCSKCRNPLLVPQASAETGRAAIKDETEVLRAGQEQLAGDEGVWGEPGSLDELLLEEKTAPSIEGELELSPVEQESGESEFSAYPGQLSEPGTFAESGVREGAPKKRRSVIFIVGGCVLGLLLAGAVFWFILAGSGAGASKVKIHEAQGFAEEYIVLLEDGKIDMAMELHSSRLQSDVQKDEVQRIAQQIGKSKIVEMKRGLTHFEVNPEGDQFFFLYNLRYEDDMQFLIVSVLEVDEELRIDGIAAKQLFGDTVSIGPSSYEELEQIVAASAAERFVSFFSRIACIIFPVILLLIILQIVSMWIVFVKAGQPGWAILIPFYNMWVLAEVGDKPGWMGLAMCFCGFIPVIGPIVGFVLSLMISIGVAKTFGRGVGFGIGLFLVPFIFFPILAFAGE